MLEVPQTANDLKAIKTRALKLHAQFAHPTADKLISLVRKSGVRDKNLEDAVKLASSQCHTCLKFKRPSPRPVVCMPLANTFNEVLAMDLKVWCSNIFLVMVDLCTRFCAATVVKNKMPSTIISGVFRSWITIFGAPAKILTDNGGEFNNPELRELGASFNVKIMATAAESPWSNGVYERLNGVIGTLVSKVSEDANCDVHMALAWSVAARNACDNNFGFSPNQLVFGFNPALPSVFTDKLPALENVLASDIVRRNLNAMHSARQSFVQLESEEKLKRAYKANVRTTLIDDLNVGDEVYYKRNAQDKWEGPANVIGMQGKQIVVRNGSMISRVHSTRLTQCPRVDTGSTDLGPKDPAENRDLTGNDNLRGDQGPESSTKSRDQNSADLGPGASHGNRDHFSDDTLREDPGPMDTNEFAEDLGPLDPNGDKDQLCSKSGLWKKGQRFQGIDPLTGEGISGKILGRAGKVTGRNKDCYNVIFDNTGWTGWYVLNTLKDLSPLPEGKESIILYSDATVTAAKEAEIKSWSDNEVFVRVPNDGQRTISVRWVITEKAVNNGQSTVKARLVARGFEEDTSTLQKDSPTCSKESIRILVALASSKKWLCHTVDVKSAYLQGDPIERTVYLKPPKDFDDDTLWLLKKTVYGLCDAARAWYSRMVKALQELGGLQCSLDMSMFYWRQDGHLDGMLCLHVDDILYCGSQNFNDTIITSLQKQFRVGSSAEASFTYLGVDFKSYTDGITVDQTQYISSISPSPITMARQSNKDSCLSVKEISDFRSLVGQLNWVATQTRPDVAFDT